MSLTLKKTLSRKENRLFLKRWLKNPGQLGTLAPISKRLAALAAQIVVQDTTSHYIIETGSGTGRLTQALLDAGIDANRLICIELDYELYTFLKKRFPSLKIFHGDASHLAQLLKENNINIDVDAFHTIISTIPLMYLKPEKRLEIVQAGFDILSSSGRYLQVTYSPISPLKDIQPLRFLSRREGSLWHNIPPGFIWHYRDLTSVETFPLTA